MAELRAHGLTVDPPAGWEGRIFRRPESGELAATGAGEQVVGAPAPPGERSFPVVQVATIALPLDIADYGSDVVEDLGPNDALVIFKEFDPADVHQALFQRAGFPRVLSSGDFQASVLQRKLDGQGGYQVFFQDGGRAFCLYVVLGDFSRRATVVPSVNRVLATFVIEPLEPLAPVVP
jgi:hypothetical protein